MLDVSGMKVEGRVRSVKRDGSRQLMTIGSDHDGWTHGIPGSELVELQGAIVRVIPPSTATAADVENIEQCLRQAGVVAVRVLPQEPGDRLLVVLPDRVQPVTMLGHRAVVSLMLEEIDAMAGEGESLQALHDLVEQVMTEEGL
jgi:hypothetical protein